MCCCFLRSAWCHQVLPRNSIENYVNRQQENLFFPPFSSPFHFLSSPVIFTSTETPVSSVRQLQSWGSSARKGLVSWGDEPASGETPPGGYGQWWADFWLGGGMTSDVTQELKHHTNCVTEWLKAERSGRPSFAVLLFFFFFKLKVWNENRCGVCIFYSSIA